MLLAGAVAGAAAFAQLLASEPAPGAFGAAALPPAPGSPLIVQAAPWSPERPATRVHRAVPAFHGTLAAHKLVLATARPVVRSGIETSSTTRSPSLPASHARVAPDPPATEPATPQPAPSQPAPSQPAPPQPAASVPVAAPAPAPSLASRALTGTAPVVTAAVASSEGRHRADNAGRHGHDSHDGQDRHDNHAADRSGSGEGGGDNGATLLSVIPPAVPTPTPVVTPLLPSVAPPSPDASHADASHADASHADASHADASHADASRADASRVDYSGHESGHNDHWDGGWQRDAAGHGSH